jgi:hypothetical protein
VDYPASQLASHPSSLPACLPSCQLAQAITNFVVKFARHPHSTQHRWVAVTAGMVGATCSDMTASQQRRLLTCLPWKD